MDRIKRARKPVRASITKTVNEIEVALADENPDRDVLLEKREKLDRLQQEIAQLDHQLKDALLDSNCTEEVLIEEYRVIEEYEDKILKWKLALNKVLSPPVGSPCGSAVTALSSLSASGHRKAYKLPKIELKKFNGDLTEWLGWWSQFSKIHNDEELDSSDKFQYLLQSMVCGTRARDLIESYPMTAENYPKAILALKERFGKDDLLVEVYVRELLKLVIHNVNSRDQKLSNLFDKLESHLRALESLGVTSAQHSAMLFPMVESSIPDEVLRAWLRCPLSSRDGTVENPPKSKLDYLIMFMKSEIEGEERSALARAGFGAVAAKDQEKKEKYERNIKRKEDLPTAAGLFAGHPPACLFCDKTHPSQECFRAQTMSLKDKTDLIKEKRRCFTCLKSGHNSRDCRTLIRCIICSKKHYVLMCPNLPTQQPSELVNPEDSTTTTMSSTECSGDVLLQTLLVKLYNDDGRKHRVTRLVFDNGSQGTAVRRGSAEDLKLQPTGEVWSRKVLYGGAVTDRKKHNKYKLKISSMDGKVQRDIIAMDEPDICGTLSRVPKGPWLTELSQKGIWLTDLESSEPEIEILVGSDYYGQLMTGRVVQLKCGLTAMQSVFGWTLSGRVPVTRETTAMFMTSSALMSCQSSVSELWSLETLGICDPAEVKSKSERELATQKHFQDTVSRNMEGRYAVKLPWIDGKVSIPDNRMIAEKRLLSTSEKLKRADMFSEYDKIFKGWMKEGFIESVNEDQKSQVHYLPHRAVFKPESLTTPVRPVFDASCKTGRNPSLNDCLERGPNLLELIPSILLRFREHKIGVIADVRKAFQMIEVSEEDRDYLRFLWWEDNDKKVVKIFRHKRVVFGVNCSPFLLGAVIELHLKAVIDSRKPVAEKLLRSLYVDNCVTSLKSVPECRDFRSTSVELMEDGKMELRQWEFGAVGTEHLALCNTTEGGSDPLIRDAHELTNVLGLKWNKVDDTLHVQIPHEDLLEKITRRTVLSQVQKIFDPMGFLCPTTLIPKVLLQKTWEKKASWDDELEDNYKKQFIAWWSETPELKKIAVPRHAFRGLNSDLVSIHSFCDASRNAYAAVIFLRVQEGDNVSVQLLQAKSRVAPLKIVTIPRLELLACTVGSRLTKSVKDSLSIQNVRTYYWSDSTTALAWIKRNDEWGTFVGNRVKEICGLSDPDHWTHVPGCMNPADLPSRGCQPVQLLKSRWWEGPDWLKCPPNEWPSQNPEPDEDLVSAEKKKSAVVHMAAMNTITSWYTKRYSSYIKNLRLVAWMLRFVDRTRKRSKETENLTQKEIDDAERVIFKLVQREVFGTPEEEIAGLRVQIDGDGLLRVKTKLLHRPDTDLFRLPVLLPNSHALVDQLIREEHTKNGHAGAQFLMGYLREKCWIIQSRKAIRRIISSCVICRRFSTKAPSVPIAPLPDDRVIMSRVFQTTGVDLGGPLYLKNGSKAWFVIFTCGVYRAIHLELVLDLSTDAFLLALYRFICRRGRPTVIYSDNGTNFVGAVNLFALLDWPRIERETSVYRIQWKFNPPTAAWWGGWWERLISSVKDLLKRMLGHRKLNYSQLLTCICEAEAIVNGRPLTYVTEDEDDLIPLTPAMFLQDNTETNYPEAEVINGNELRGKYTSLNILKEELRSRFRKEYLAQLVHRGKSKKPEVFAVGDVVLIGSDNKKRLEWPMGRIEILFPGKDKEVRVAKVKTSAGSFIRPLQRLFPLEVSSPEDSPKLTEKVKKRAVKEKELGERFEENPTIFTRYGRQVKIPKRFEM